MLAPEAGGTLLGGVEDRLYRWDPASPGTITQVLKSPSLKNITGLAVDASGDVIVTDDGRTRPGVQRPEGDLFRVASSTVTRVVPEGSSPFIYPRDVALDADGNYIVADTLAGPPLYLSLPRGTEYRSGDYFYVDVIVRPIGRSFDAWALVQAPGGDYYTIDVNHLNVFEKGASASARGVEGLAACVNRPLIAGWLPDGIEPGNYTIIAGLVPAGVTPSGTGSAIAGYVDTATIVIR